MMRQWPYLSHLFPVPAIQGLTDTHGLTFYIHSIIEKKSQDPGILFSQTGRGLEQVARKSPASPPAPTPHASTSDSIKESCCGSHGRFFLKLGNYLTVNTPNKHQSAHRNSEALQRQTRAHEKGGGTGRVKACCHKHNQRC